jgi:hypothetical protein
MENGFHLADSASYSGKEIADNGYPAAVQPTIKQPIYDWELSRSHRYQLETESAISSEAVQARGYFTLPDNASGRDWLKARGFSKEQCALGECLVIPIHDWRGQIVEYVLRPNIARHNIRTGKARKYEARPKSTPVLDVSALTLWQLGNPQIPILITEGAKKADSAASRGFCAISLNGVYGFRGKNLQGGLAALPDFEEIVWSGIDKQGNKFPRLVYIVYDSDVMEKDGVYNALVRLAGLLHRRGAMVKVVNLKAGESGQKTGLDDFFARGGTAEQLKALACDLVGMAERGRIKANSKKQLKAEQIQVAAQASGVPLIETNGRQLKDKLSDLSEAIAAINSQSPFLFRGLSGLVTISHDALNEVKIRRVGRAAMASLASRAAFWVSTNEREGQSEVHPPRDLCESYLEDETYWKAVPPLERVASAPFFAPDGTLCDRSGYYQAARTWLSLPEGFDMSDTTPTPENVAAAKILLLQTILGEVAFADDCSRSHALALMILPFVRAMISGPTPLHLWNAPMRGSGKSYAAELCIAPFAVPSAQVEKGNAEEWRKSIFTKLVLGPSHIFLDNITGSLNSAMLDAAITAESGYVEERLTGTGEMVKASTRCVWVATANNARLTEDAASRSIVISIDANCENPDKRHFSHDPAAYIREHRGEVCGAIITLVRAWQAAGEPSYQGDKKCRFPKWLGTMGGILETNGINGLLENLEETHDAIGANQTDEWHEFTEIWAEEFGDVPQTASELLPFAQKVPDLAIVLHADFKPVSEKKLAACLGRKLNRVFGEWKIMRGPRVNRKATFKCVSTKKPVETDIFDD